jgi:hypothetical protein
MNKNMFWLCFVYNLLLTDEKACFHNKKSLLTFHFEVQN